MLDYIYKSATIIGYSLDGIIIRRGCHYDQWLVGTSNSNDFEICMETLDKTEAKRTIDFLISWRGIKLDPESKEGKYVYLKSITPP